VLGACINHDRVSIAVHNIKAKLFLSQFLCLE